VGNVEEPTLLMKREMGPGGLSLLACAHVKGFGKELSGMWTE
jgi:hypothetical protein